MGFETALLYINQILIVLLFELFPYGIWNCSSQGCKGYKAIWTISLWDLKQGWFFYQEKTRILFELFPYGIWNVEKVSKMFQRFDLNYFPMGFETLKKFLRCFSVLKFELFPYGIWNWITTEWE